MEGEAWASFGENKSKVSMWHCVNNFLPNEPGETDAGRVENDCVKAWWNDGQTC